MKSKLILKLVALGGMMLALFVLLASAAKPGVVSATMNPLPPLLSCPNVDGSDSNTVTVADILSVVQHFGHNYGSSVGYTFLDDLVSPYNSTNPTNTGQETVADILAVVQKFGHVCPVVDTQIAKATRAIGDPTFSDILCDDVMAPLYTTPTLCGGSTQFLTENVPFLTGKGYRLGSSDVPGQGKHYVNYAYWNGIFNPVRPPGLVYTGGVLVAQLYYAAGDSNATLDGSAGVGWGPAPTSNVRAVNMDAFPCTPPANEPPSIGACSWSGSNDGFHWHANLCTVGIGTSNALAFPMGGTGSPSNCASFGATWMGHSCTFPPAANFDCAYAPAVGWMGHLWNWLPNANYTSAAPTPPSPICQPAYCSTHESNGRFADCSPAGGFTAYDCPQ